MFKAQWKTKWKWWVNNKQMEISIYADVDTLIIHEIFSDASYKFIIINLWHKNIILDSYNQYTALYIVNKYII